LTPTGGADELVHRALKEFGSQTLPFKRFGANAAFYYTMAVAFFFYECFKEDVTESVVPLTLSHEATPQGDRLRGQDRSYGRPQGPQGHTHHMGRAPDPKALGTESCSTSLRLGLNARSLPAK